MFSSSPSTLAITKLLAVTQSIDPLDTATQDHGQNLPLSLAVSYADLLIASYEKHKLNPGTAALSVRCKDQSITVEYQNSAMGNDLQAHILKSIDQLNELLQKKPEHQQAHFLRAMLHLYLVRPDMKNTLESSKVNLIEAIQSITSLIKYSSHEPVVDNLEQHYAQAEKEYIAINKKVIVALMELDNHQEKLSTLLATHPELVSWTNIISGETLLTAAARGGCTEGARAILERPECTNKIISSKNKSGQTAENVAEQQGHHRIATLIRHWQNAKSVVMPDLTICTAAALRSSK